MKTIIKHKNKIIVITIILIIIAIPIGLLFYIRPVHYKGSFMMYAETGEGELVEFDVYKHRKIGKPYALTGSIFIRGKEYSAPPNITYAEDTKPHLYWFYHYKKYPLYSDATLRLSLNWENDGCIEILLFGTGVYKADIDLWEKLKK